VEHERLARIKRWFDTYTRSFLTGHPTDDSPLVLKIEHTARVSENMQQLGNAIHLPAGKKRAAEAVGWLHDVGRFRQYRQYHTFNDRQSVNHASLAIDIIGQESVLVGCQPDEDRAIRDAVRFHNAPALPGNRPHDSTVLMKMIRDADKLDIWRVFADFCRNGNQPEAAVVQHLSDHPTWEPAIIDAIMQGRMARFQDMRSVCDFKLLQLSWVFDLYWPESLKQAERRGDLAEIGRSLPDHRIIRDAVDHVMSYLFRQPAAQPVSDGPDRLAH
jgi:hypothetical protein